jgi:CubicO group peptidase (beta-lactamase class C family)
MQRYVDDGRLAGIVTLVANKGYVVQQGCYGMADIAAGRPMQPDTIFRLWSSTKWVAAVALMTLFEEGHFVLDQDVAEFIPEFKDTKVFVAKSGDDWELAERKSPITIRQALTHTTGMGHGITNTHPVNARLGQAQKAWFANGADLAEVARGLAAIPLIYQPGTRWNYSLSLEIVARLVEIISGQPYETFLRERLLDPLGLTSSGYTLAPRDVKRFSALYGPAEGGGLKVLESMDEAANLPPPPKWTPGSYGMLSTICDYHRFGQMLLNGGTLDGQRILGPRTVALMAANHLRPDQLPYNFDDSPPVYGYGHGLGVHVLMDRGLAGLPCANGEYWKDGGAGTLCWIDPTFELVGLVFYQHVPHSAYPVFTQFRNLVYQAME